MSPALVVLAAGLSSRYGRLKQLEPVGPAGESLLDFTIADAARAGFAPVVVAVLESTAGEFVAHFERHPPAVEVGLVLQARDGRPAFADDGSWRPWGTAHAVLSAASQLEGPFGVANADDYYGYGALEALAAWSRSGPGDAALIAFRLDRTLSAEGGVSRAVCEVEDGWLTSLSEHIDVRAGAGGTISHAGGPSDLDPASPVSMNLWGFRPVMLEVLRTAFEEFRSGHGSDPTTEFRLPDVVSAAIEAGAVSVRVIESPSSWSGLTFAGDRPAVMDRLRRVADTNSGTGGQDGR